MKKRISLGLLLLASTFPLQAAEAPAAALLASCAACHGEQGQGNTAIGAPRLAGQHADYLAQQLRNFKGGQRAYDPRDQYGAQMRDFAATLDEADIEHLARHYAALQLPLPSIDEGERGLGEAIYQNTCAACHGPRAEGFALLKTPNLRILDTVYMQRQMSNYVQGLRGSEEHADQLGVWMRGISLQIDEVAEREAVINYIGNLPARQ
jgi:cytochrome c oxidase subunit 2